MNRAKMRLAEVESLELRRLLSGGLDPSFGIGGKVLSTGFPAAAAVAVQPDGKILVASTVANPAGHGDTDFLVTRYNVDGSIDPTFGSEGSGDTATDLGGNDTASAVAVGRDGTIVVAGSSDANFAVVRYTPDGHLDTTFNAGGTPGRVITDFGGASESAHAVLVQGDGGIVIGGSTFNPATPLVDMALVRYQAGGSLDLAFGSGGEEVLDLGGFDSVNALAMAPDGNIVAGGVTAGGLSSDFAIVRFEPNGTPDPTFGTGGVVLGIGGIRGSGGFNSIAAVTVAGDDEVIAAGNATDSAALFRYDATGHLDTAFGSGGAVITKLGKPSTELVGFKGVAVGPGGSVFAAGSTTTAGDGSSHDFVGVRYTSAGVQDPTFGTGGVEQTDFSGTDDLVTSLAVGPDFRVVAAGSVDHQAALTRYIYGSLIDSGTFTGVGTPPAGVTPPIAPVPPPSAELSAATRLRAAGAKFYSFAVTYRGATDATVASRTVVVRGPGGYTGVAEFVSLSHRRRSSRVVATYRLRAPQGRWTAADNGTYTIMTLNAKPRAAKSTDGAVGTFTVRIASTATRRRQA